MKSAAGSPEDAAAEWLARRDAGFSPADEAAFEAWCAADPRHAAAVAELAAAWSTVLRPRRASRGEEVWQALAARAARRRRRFAAWGATGLSLAAAAVFLAFRPAGPGDTVSALAVALPATVTARPETRTLADGSSVELNAGAEIAVDFSAGLRRVRLVRGEALFAVAKDPARPFVVQAAAVEVRAIGTRFSVGVDPQAVAVLVTEGRVAVARPSPADTPDATPVFVSGGGRVTLPPDDRIAAPPAVEAVAPAEIDRALAWRHHRVEFSGTPLAEAVALFNRRNRVQLALGDPALAGTRVSGIFWTDNPAGFARLLEASFALTSRTQPDGTIELRR